MPLSIRAPDEIYAELFENVQCGRIFRDSKTFADCIPKAPPGEILTRYRERRAAADFDLAAFVREEFELPPQIAPEFAADPERPVEQHIELLWDVLTRPGAGTPDGSSLIPLPHPYVVPGGRFREVYYWDSYFTLLGLQAAGRIDLIEAMLRNFSYLIETFGFVPNGNRTYYATRSQPPFYSLMVELLAEQRNDESVWTEFLPFLSLEYRFWMDGGTSLSGTGSAYRRVVRVGDTVLNRYWDDRAAPRPESYREDRELGGALGGETRRIFREIRAAGESGWDFSSRWLADGRSMTTIRTTDLAPVDLNCLLWRQESALAKAHEVGGDEAAARRFRSLASRRTEAMRTLFWDETEGFFFDWLVPESRTSEIATLAAAFPLYFRLASDEQARRVAERIEEDFLKPGGLVTTLNRTGEQWDAPNGWAPLQWMAYRGLRNYGLDELARRAARNWVDNCLRVYRNTGKLVEKYDVMDVSLPAGGGEYPNQDGFGWTNAVLVCLMQELAHSR